MVPICFGKPIGISVEYESILVCKKFEGKGTCLLISLSILVSYQTMTLNVKYRNSVILNSLFLRKSKRIGSVS